MPKTAGFRLFLLAILLSVCYTVSSFGAEPGLGHLVSPQLLKHANLEIAWEEQLPLMNGEKLERMFILGNHIYALSDRNYLFSFDRENGKRVFGKPVAPAGTPVGELGLYGDEFILTFGSTLIEADILSGMERKPVKIEYGIKCLPARNSSFYYISGVDKRLHVLQAKNMVQVFEVAAENNSAVTSIVADEDFVVFTTEAGNVIAISPDMPVRLWQFDAGAAIAGAVIRDRMSLFFASKDTNVYRLDIGGPTNIRLIWKYQMPGILDRTPQVTETTVYQYARIKGLTAIDKESGRYIWSLPEGIELLAEAQEKAYVITKNRTLTIMDNMEAKKLYSVNFAQVSKYAANTDDPKIYIGDETGRIVCLQSAKVSFFIELVVN